MASRIVLVTLAFLSACIGMAAFTAAQTDTAKPDDRLHQLMTQRRDTLRARAEAVEAGYSGGVESLDSLLAAKKDLLTAELELTSSRAERIVLRESMVADMKLAEDTARASLNSGTGTTQNSLAASAERLLAEIELLRELEN